MTKPSDASAQQLSNAEKRVLLALKDGRPAALADVQARSGLAGETETMSAASWLRAKGLVQIEETPSAWVTLSEEGLRYAKDGLPERRVYNFVRTRGGSASHQDLRNATPFTSEDVAIALTWWKRKKFGDLVKRGAQTVLVAVDEARPTPDEAVLAKLADGQPHAADKLDAAGLELLKARKGVVRLSERKARTVALTEAGRHAVSGPLSVDEEISQLTPELIQSGAWKQKAIRPYNVATPAPRPVQGKPHPLVQLIEEIRDIFVELGFQEIQEEYVVPSLWNMDALFIPQDHPARDMQDTFYLEEPARLPVEAPMVDLVRSVHETGAGTGSRGWGGRFDPKEAERALLRTHTTVGTIRHLSRNPQGPLRVFSVGRVFRKETMDSTHLPEFHQIEGIATEPGADFRMLLGILQEFYRRLGFQKLRWRPAYFPYTEPSMEVEVWTGSRWMELGGCGIFRPEVTQPLGVTTPVLAWGLGLERLAMLRFGLSDIRQIYWSDLEWLRQHPLL